MKGFVMRRVWAILLLLPITSLGGCGEPGKAAVEGALERGWASNPQAMGALTGLIDGSELSGASRGAGSAARIVVDTAKKFGGDVAGEVSKDVIGGAASLAEQFAGKTAVGNSIAWATASDWDVRNLEILDERASGDDYVVRLRYDLFATIGGERQEIGKDLTETARMTLVDGRWEVIK